MQDKSHEIPPPGTCGVVGEPKWQCYTPHLAAYKALCEDHHSTLTIPFLVNTAALPSNTCIVHLGCARLGATLRGMKRCLLLPFSRLKADDHIRQPGSEAVQNASEMHTRAGTIDMSSKIEDSA